MKSRQAYGFEIEEAIRTLPSRNSENGRQHLTGMRGPRSGTRAEVSGFLTFTLKGTEWKPAEESSSQKSL
jgi:hypothetical protein